MPDIAEIWSRLAPGDRVMLSGAAGEPTAALASLREDPDRARGLTFAGVWLPGVNRFDPTEGVPEATAEAIFIHPQLREGWTGGRIRHMPLHYRDADRWLSGPARLDAAILQVTPPENGFVTPGIACDFHEAALDSGARLIGEINPLAPTPPDAPRIPVDRFAALIEPPDPRAPITYDPGDIPDDLRTIARLIADTIRPGDTVQVGIGKAAAAMMEALTDHRGLAYHAGLVLDGMLPLLDRDVFSGGVTTNTLVGSAELYAQAGPDPRIRYRPVRHTHDFRVISAIPRFTAINSALNVDLLGQSTAEMLNGRQISGTGGAGDFQRGARASEGGRAVIALPATAGGGKYSRIVPRLEPGGLATIPRADADVVVTEHGLADLRWLDADARAKALIGVAAPEFRDDLAKGWEEMRRGM
ncbi:MAG: acetyl-CoA hydrolase/transferase family protein [Pseudomonadota bacterium]